MSYKQITEVIPRVSSKSEVSGNIEKASGKSKLFNRFLLQLTGQALSQRDLKGKETAEVNGVVLAGAMEQIEGGDTVYAEIPGQSFKIEMGMTASKADYHEPMDALGGVVMKVINPKNKQEFEVALAFIADGVSMVNNDQARDSAAISQVACSIGMRSMQEQIKRRGGYDMDITYTDIRNELRKRGLSHGATTFQMLVVTPSEKQDNQALALVYSFGSTRNRNGKSDLGPVLFYGPDGALSNSYFMGINQPDQFMTGDGRLLNYDLQAYRIPSGGKVVLTTDGNLNPDNLTEKQTNVKKGENFRQFFRKITGSGRGEVNPDDTSLVSITVGDDIKRVSSIKK